MQRKKVKDNFENINQFWVNIMTRNTGQKGINLMPVFKDREKAMTDITQSHCDVFVVVFNHVQ